MVQVKKEYKEIEIEDYSDLVAEPHFELFFNNGENERQEEGTLRGGISFFWLRWYGYVDF